MGKRKPFIVWGYILWGIFTILFGVIDFFADGIFAGNVVALGVMVIVADALMSFFGSLGNDAGFNPHLTDITTPENRGPLGAVIAVQPVIANHRRHFDRRYHNRCGRIFCIFPNYGLIRYPSRSILYVGG